VTKLSVLADKELSEFYIANKLRVKQNKINERRRWLSSHAYDDEKEDVRERLTNAEDEIGSLMEEKTELERRV